ncbi:MAG: undecaprenyl-diphosphate phosphatase [Elusimicrobia bacterium]|nr:undecaprenyl-diphosphate phosphatase [Candidatus Obscuribacterium magneticum]
MNFLQSTVFGLVQGLTEFLPISSSAHLILLPRFLNWTDPGLAFDVSLHSGTLMALLLYFRKDIVILVADALKGLKNKDLHTNKLPWQILVATLPGALLGALFEEQAETVFRSPLLIAGTLALAGLFLWYADRFYKHTVKLGELTWTKALLIGLSQGLAIVPGISRSGITMGTALLLGLERPAAVLFSFYLSLPIILGAWILKSPELISSATDPSLWVGLTASFLSGLSAIHFLLRYIRTKTFTPFVIYRLLLALVILATLFGR